MKKYVLLITLITIIFIFGFFYYLDIFKPVKIRETKIGPFIFVYEQFTGDYSKTGPIFERIYYSLLSDKIKPGLSLAIFYDDPKTTPKEKLRSDCGIIIEKQELKKINALKGKYRVKNIGPQLSVVADFPLKNKLSFLVGALKVYPAINQHFKEKEYLITNCMELYDKNGKKITYIMGFKKKEK